jgi:hypothetical protein
MNFIHCFLFIRYVLIIYHVDIMVHNILTRYFEYEHNKRIIQIFEFHDLYIINDQVYLVTDTHEQYHQLINNIMSLSIINNEKINVCTLKYFGEFKSNINIESWNYHDT